MSKKRKILTAVAVVLVLLVVTFLFTKSRWNHGDLSDPDKMIERIENALGDDFKKQTKTEVVATLVYGNGKESDNINYHILKTTYYEADPNDVTGLNVDALGVLFNPETAVSCETMKIQEWDAALFKSFALISVSCLHFGQNRGKFSSIVSGRIFVRVLFPQIGQSTHLSGDLIILIFII